MFVFYKYPRSIERQKKNNNSMNEEDEFSFAEECQRLCVNRDSMGMIGDMTNKKEKHPWQ